MTSNVPLPQLGTAFAPDHSQAYILGTFSSSSSNPPEHVKAGDKEALRAGDRKSFHSCAWIVFSAYTVITAQKNSIPLSCDAGEHIVQQTAHPVGWKLTILSWKICLQLSLPFSLWSEIMPHKAEQGLQLQLFLCAVLNIIDEHCPLLQGASARQWNLNQVRQGVGPCRHKAGSRPLILAAHLTWSLTQLWIFAWLKSWNHANPSGFTCFHPQRKNWPRFPHS